MFVDFFIKRPVFATVLALLTVIAGAIAIPTLPVAQYPQLAAPQVTVTAAYTGASSQDVETSVTNRLEEVINGVEGMRYIQSTSSNDGIAAVTITFDLDRDIDLAAVDVQNRVQQALPFLPAIVRNNGVTVAKNSNAFVLAAAFWADDKYSVEFVSNYVDRYVRNAVKRVPGVGEAIIFGERKYAMRLWLDPGKLAARGLTAGDVVRALQEQNVPIAAGQIGREPAVPGQAMQMSIRAEGRLANPAEFERLIIKTATDGTLVTFADVGRAEVGAEDYGTRLRFNGKEAVGLGVLQLANANALDVEEQVKARLAEVATSFPPGFSHQIAFNPTEAVRESISEVLSTLLEAIGLVVVVIFVFLQGWRATLIPAITIPVSLIGTFLFVKAFGFSINTLTLFGLTLATGLVVDDAIVVIENIERHIAERKIAAREAAPAAMREVAGAVIATSLVLIAVFVPVAMFPGTSGRIYIQFSLTIAFSIALSAFNALTLTPALSAILLRHNDRPRGLFFRGVNHVIHAVTMVYRRLLGAVLRHQVIASLAFVAAVGATVYVYDKVPSAFVPDEDQGYFIIIVQAPPGASLQQTMKVTKQIEDIVLAQPEVAGSFNVNGFSFTGSAGNKATVFVTLKPFAERTGPGHSAQAVLGRVAGPLFGLRDAFVFPFLPPPIQGIGNFGGFQFHVEDRGGGSIDRVAAAAGQLMGAAAQHPKLAGVFSSFTVDDPQLVIEIDREQAKSLGISLDEINAALQVNMGATYVNDFELNERTYRVYAQADKQFRTDPNDIRELYVRSATGQMVSLDALVTIRETTGPQTINHYNLFRSAELNGSPAPGVSSGEALAAMEEIGAQLPAGISYEWSGLSLEELESGGQTFIIFFLGVLVVYLVLAAQYESFALPMIIMCSVPTAILGALLAQWGRGLQNDVFAQIGMVMLVGLASKNAILIVEFAEQLRSKGMPVAEAALEAAQIRLRPILMTSFAFILGVLPLVFAGGAGQASRHSLGTAVAGGMALSTVLNLFFIPALYVLVERLRERRFGRPAAVAVS